MSLQSVVEEHGADLTIACSAACMRVLSAVCLFCIVTCNALNEDLVKKLTAASDKTQTTLKSLLTEWSVKEYPNFLKSCFMHKSSWEIMKYKYMHRILDASVSKTRKQFVASFMGSSVTAGHDSHYNQSHPLVLGDIMKSSFVDADIDFVSRNVALGNNPCMPYDICAKYFAGFDADVVHWEQNYFCDGSSIMEHFIRQSMTIPARPIVVFSEAQTGHWDSNGKECKTHHKVTSDEEVLLSADPLKLVSELNKDEYHRAFGFVSSVDKNYHGAGIQSFTHMKHTDYACLGPYIKDWMKGAASWHPSVVAHRLRASHHAYFWLLIWQEALKEVLALASHRAADAILKDVEHHQATLYPPLHPAQHRFSVVVDDMKCYTDYEPRAVQEASLKRRIVGGLAKEEADKGWHFVIYEDLVDKNLVKNSLRQGYADFKKLVHGNDKSGPISITVPGAKEGPLILCETPGIWGKLPDGYVHFYESKAEVYLTLNVAPKDSFEFKQDAAKALTINHSKELDICSSLQLEGKDSIPAGDHVLTIVPKSEQGIIVAWLLTA